MHKVVQSIYFYLYIYLQEINCVKLEVMCDVSLQSNNKKGFFFFLFSSSHLVIRNLKVY